MVEVSQQRVRALAGFFRETGGVRPFDFCSASEGVIFPPRNRPGVVECFFFCTAQQFGFWRLDGERYAGPMLGRLDGEEYKGSDYMFHCATRAWTRQPDFFCPDQLVQMNDAQWARVFCDDQGHNPLPMWPERLALIYGYTRWFQDRQVTPTGILKASQRSAAPLATFLGQLADMPGYGEDPLRKKLMLLAMILENRPEHFLRVTDPDAYAPIIDYHLQRSALRTGLVRINDAGLRDKLVARRLVTAGEEQAIRAATFEAVRLLIRESGLSVAAVDYFFFMSRKRCPEMAEPVCADCPLRSVCARETRLFQPVFRTTCY